MNKNNINLSDNIKMAVGSHEIDWEIHRIKTEVPDEEHLNMRCASID